MPRLAPKRIFSSRQANQSEQRRLYRLGPHCLAITAEPVALSELPIPIRPGNPDGTHRLFQCSTSGPCNAADRYRKPRTAGALGTGCHGLDHLTTDRAYALEQFGWHLQLPALLSV